VQEKIEYPHSRSRGTCQPSPARTWKGARQLIEESCLAPTGQVVAQAPPPHKTDCIFNVTDAPLLRKT